MPGTFPRSRKPDGGPCLLIRAAEGPAIGMGHAVRCGALAQHWSAAGGDVVFVSARGEGASAGRTKAERLPHFHIEADPGTTRDAEFTAELARRMRAAWIVCDGYYFDADYQRILKGAAASVLAMDDFAHASWYSSDIILNQNLHAAPRLYEKRQEGARLLMGPSFALLRTAFLRYAGWEKSTSKTARNALVTIGGGDRPAVVARAMEALAESKCDLDAIVVVGPASLHGEMLRAKAARMPFRCTVVQNADDMPALMHWADIAISGGGSTCWELAFMGVPTLAVAVVEHQRQIASGLAAAGFCYDVWHEDFGTREFGPFVRQWARDAGARRAMSEAGRRIVDGLGGWRVVREMGTIPVPDERNLRAHRASSLSRQ